MNSDLMVGKARFITVFCRVILGIAGSFRKEGFGGTALLVIVGVEVIQAPCYVWVRAHSALKTFGPRLVEGFTLYIPIALAGRPLREDYDGSQGCCDEDLETRNHDGQRLIQTSMKVNRGTRGDLVVVSFRRLIRSD